MPLGHST